MGDIDTDCGLSCLHPSLYYISWIVSGIASLLSLIMVLSMTIPLLYKERRKQYSSYNLYLAFLSVLDLVVIFCFLIIRVKRHLDPTLWIFENPDGDLVMDPSFDNSTFIGGFVASLYLNAFIAYEIYSLLFNSNQMRHHNSPSILKVFIQAGISYSIAITASIINFYLFDSHEMKENATIDAKISYLVCTTIFFIGIPISVLFYVFFKIWCGQLLQLNDLYEGRLRFLAMFFAKILFVNVLIFILALIRFGMFVTYDHFNHPQNPSRYITSFLCVILSMVSFALSMTKPDAYKLVIDLLSFQYCKCESCSCYWYKFSFCWKNKQLQQQQQQQQQQDQTEDGTIVEMELPELHFDPYLRRDKSIHSARTNIRCDNDANNDNDNDNNKNDRNINDKSSNSNERRSEEASIVTTETSVFLSSNICNIDIQNQDDNEP